jgi:inner membrane protein YhjD
MMRWASGFRIERNQSGTHRHMIPLVSWVRRTGDAARERGAVALGAARRRWRWFDHLARAYQRYQDSRGDRMAAAMTYFGFLSFFPLLALAYALLGYVVGVSDRARAYLVDATNSVLPGRLPVEQIAHAKAAAGVIGLVGLLITGLGWMDAARESLRQIWGTDPRGGNFFVNKLVDVGLLAFLGAILIMSAVVSGTAIHATHAVLGLLGIADVLGMGTALWVLSLCVAGVFDAVAFLVVFSRISGTRAPWRHIIRGAVFGAVGFELLKLIATLLVEHTTHNPVYASFAVVAGLLVWIDVVSRFFLFTAAWTATRRVILRADAATDAATAAAAAAAPLTTVGAGDGAAREDGAAQGNGAAREGSAHQRYRADRPRSAAR